MLIKVTAKIEEMVWVEDNLTIIDARIEAINIIKKVNFAALRTDLRVVNPNDPSGVRLTTKPITKKSDLSQQNKEWFAWCKDGGTTNKTCGEILSGINK